MPKTKLCTGCGTAKPLTEYYRRRDSSDGFYQRCKACCALSCRRRYLKSRQQILAHQRDYYAAHKKEICAAKKAYQKTHRQYSRDYYRRNEAKLLEYGRKYREAKKS